AAAGRSAFGGGGIVGAGGGARGMRASTAAVGGMGRECNARCVNGGARWKEGPGNHPPAPRRGGGEGGDGGGGRPPGRDRLTFPPLGANRPPQCARRAGPSPWSPCSSACSSRRWR